VTITVNATTRLRLATTPATAAVAVWRWSTARATASAATGSGAPRKPFSNSATTCGTRLMPPRSSTPTQAYAPHGIACHGGASASSPASAINPSPAAAGQLPLAALLRPLRLCAGAMPCAARAGHQPPANAETTPSAP